MYLKKLELQGFKSFPEYTLVEFDKGMTAVVGPNGSGKSNVTDAIRWVLGEQSVKSLRGGKMEDVIFNGTQSRKAMNYAEVSITFDNSDHFLDYEFDEIQITRRLYRSGESEYQINHVNCRLKDITRLFLDTGLGKDGYSIIGQGRVDEILSTKSEDRRRVIEEASGIVKYKVRKEEAERKLRSTEQNLLRIDDLLGQLSERIEPLKQQSEDAIKYHKAYDELKTKDISLLIHKINNANSQMGNQGEYKSQLEADIKVQEDLLLKIRSDNMDVTNKLNSIEDEIEMKRQELSDISEEIFETKSEGKLALQSLEHLKDSQKAYEDEKSELLSQIKISEENILEKQAKADELLTKAQEEESLGNKIKASIDELEEEYRSKAEINEDTKEKLDYNTQELLTYKNQINHYETKISSLDDKINELSISRVTNNDLLSDVKKQLADSDEVFKNAMKEEASIHSDIALRKEKLEDIKGKESKLLASYEQKNNKFTTIKTRINTLIELEKRKEGYQESVRRLVNYANDNSLGKKIVGILGDLISVDEKYEIAIEIALGNAIHNVVTHTEQEASDLIDVLKRERLGRVTFLPIENIKSRDIDKETENKASIVDGYIDIASNLVFCDSSLNDIISNLLGRIIICDDLDNARKIAKKISYGSRIITLSGDAINPGGSLTGGSVRKNGAGILGRSREIEELKRENEQIERDLALLEVERQEIDEESNDIKVEIAKLEEFLKYYSVERAKAETTYNNLKNRLDEINTQCKEIELNLEQYSKEKLSCEEDLEETRTVLSEVEDNLASLRESINNNAQEFEDYNNKISKLRDEVSEHTTSAQRFIAERNGVLSIIDVHKQTIKNLEQSISRKDLDNDENNKQVELLNKKVSDFEAMLKDLSKRYDEKNKEVALVIESKSKLDEEISSFADRLTSCSDRLNSLRNEFNNLVNKYERYILEIDTCKNSLWENYETTFDNVKDSDLYIKLKDSDVASINRDIAKLRSEIKAIGPVNHNSIAEYKEVSEKYEFMSSQRDDIYKAKQDLEKVISDLIEEMRSQFISHFEIINNNFKTVFEDLFNGGTAEILLGDDDVLSCDIEIKAQPPGKKLQNLTLLSGGERCLTAIALLFAILQLRPSPFVVLDEVEAALDDVNVSRFTDFVRRYCARSQFIIVTHRKGTMEACDRMYGVTMQERGISKILSMRLGE